MSKPERKFLPLCFYIILVDWKKNYLKLFFLVWEKPCTLRGPFCWIISLCKHTFAPLCKSFYLSPPFFFLALLEKPWCVKLIWRMPSSFRKPFILPTQKGSDLCFSIILICVCMLKTVLFNTGLKGCTFPLYSCVDVCLNLCIRAGISVVYFRL